MAADQTIPTHKPRSVLRRSGAVVCVLVACLGIVAAGGARGAVPSAPPAVTTYAADTGTTPVSVTVVGDSLSSGYKTPGNPWTLPAQQSLDAAGIPVVLTNASGAGSGYEAQGEYDYTFADWVRVGVTSATQAVILFGSDNDADDAGYAAAVGATLDLVRAIAPDALIVVVGPPATKATPASSLTGIRTTLQQVATTRDAQFVDALDWFAGAAASYLGPDGEHPNDAGEDYLASRFVSLIQPLASEAVAARAGGAGAD